MENTEVAGDDEEDEDEEEQDSDDEGGEEAWIASVFHLGKSDEIKYWIQMKWIQIYINKTCNNIFVVVLC